MRKLLVGLFCALLATPALAAQTRNPGDRTDALYGGLAGLAIGAGVALLEQDHNWGRDLSIGAGAGLLVGAAFGAVDAASADRTMSAADLRARSEMQSSQKHPGMLAYKIGF